MRSFRYLIGGLALLLVLTQLAPAQLLNGQIPLAGKTIPKYVDPLPTFIGARVDATAGSLTISAKELSEQVLPSAYPQTKAWGYEIQQGATVYPAHWPSFTIEAKRGVPLQINYRNKLGNATLYTPVSASLPGIIPVDQSIHWADPLNTGKVMTTYSGPIPIVPHLHGGEVQSIYDGGPDGWFTPENDPNYAEIDGPSFAKGVSHFYNYPNSQEAATIWYHDHALGATRLNVYAGLAGFYFLRDNMDDGTVTNPLHLPAGNYEFEMAIQDRMFDTQGQLYFPNLGINPTLHPFWIPEFFGDVITVNGKTWPYMNVEPRRYRIHLLDGSNARFYELYLYNNTTLTKGPTIWQIGTDGGLLDVPVMIDQNSKLASIRKLLIAPGERADLIIDFSGFAGQTLTLMNSAKAPYPAGTPPDPKTVGQIMQFRVGTTVTGGTDASYNPAGGAALRTPLVKLVNFAAGTAAATVDVKRQLTLKEIMGMAGPMEVLVNNAHYMADITERPTEGDVEQWQIINLTADAHPMHLHLVQYQLVSRQPFDVGGYMKAYSAAFPGGLNPMDGITYPAGVFMPGFGPPKANDFYAPIMGGNPDVTPFLKGKPVPADLNEQGWKDTYKMYPGEVTTVLVRFAPTDKPLATPKSSLTFDFDPSVGPGYVWHCHIVDHEDNDMMRPYAVNPNPVRLIGPVARPDAAAAGGRAYSFALNQNFPNPFNPSTDIRFEIPADGHVSLKVYNVLGEEVATLVNEFRPAGSYAARWNAASLPSGAYYYTIRAGAYNASKMMVLAK